MVGGGRLVTLAAVSARSSRALAKHLFSGLPDGRDEDEQQQRDRDCQEDQADRMTEMVDEHSRWNRSVLALLILSFAALVAIFIAVLSS